MVGIVTEQLSEKIKSVQMALIFLIVYLHGYHLIPYNTNVVNIFFQNFVSQEIARIAVPLFFMISGYLFFIGNHQGWQTYPAKWRRRCKTLLVPYILWSTIGLLFYWLLQKIPFAGPYFSRKLIKDYSFQELLFTLLWQPVPYQLWFIRDLMFYTLLTPMIHALSVRNSTISVLFIVFLWIFGPDVLGMELHFLAFYWSGCFLAIQHINISDTRHRHFFRGVAILWGILVCMNACAQAAQIMLPGVIHRVTILTGILAFWYNFDFIENIFRKNSISRFISFSFFIFAFHEPMLTVFKKAAQTLAGSPENFAIARYMACPFAAFLVSIWAGVMLRKFFQPVYNILTGGR